MTGRIIKGIAGFYYVITDTEQMFECKAKGIFRKDKKKPLVGDYVEMSVLDEKECTGSIDVILERKNDLIRPNVANVDQALIIFALAGPKPNLNLLDRFLLIMEKQQIPTIICFNKRDLVQDENCEQLKEDYGNCGYDVLFLSAKEGIGIEQLRERLHGKTTVAAGPSGVGKSSIINLLQSGVKMQTGEISRKIDRGKHTTRHSELIYVEKDTYIVDTPGFSSLFIEEFDKEELHNYYKEFSRYEPGCRFLGCTHIHEPVCGVKQALQEGKISSVRYDNYVLLYKELKEKRKY